VPNMKNTLVLGISIVAITASVAIAAQYFAITTPPPPLRISHSPFVTATIAPTVAPTPSITTSASAAPTPTPTPAPTFIPGAKPTDWKIYRNYEWQFEVKLPPSWVV